MNFSGKTITVVLVTTSLVLASSLGWVIVNYASIISQKESLIKEKDIIIASLNSQISELSTKVEKFQIWLEQNRTLLNQVHTWLKENITYMQSQISNTNTQMTILQNQVSSLNNQIVLLDSQIKSLQNQIGSIKIQDASRIFQLASPSVVQIRVYNSSFQLLSLGSGFIYDNNGHVVTNYHVIVDGRFFIIITYDNEMFNAYLIGADPQADLAVLRADLPAKYPSLKLSDTVTIGEPVYAIGSPFGLTGSITVGIISQVNRSVQDVTYIPMLQTDAAVNPGNSGGPLLNSRGEVVGVTTAGIAKYVGEGIGFAIPVQIVKKIVPSLIKYGVYKHPYIGVYGVYLDPIIASYYNLPKEITSGFLIVNIIYNTPAYKSDLKVNDVIIAIDDYPIKKDPDISYLMAYKYSPGDKITITIIRDGKILKIPLTLGERP
ncbi:MAG: trypsin-like peptidase domain-containing protein [Nitrososphaeria archaeon]|nr:trypsin-like peptidase domain-containing protein [Nitrososphaeria archaeon]